jgi:hypothetical protein
MTATFRWYGVASEPQSGSKRAVSKEKPLTVRLHRPSIRAGARERRCTMRHEFASKSFLAVSVTGVVLLCSGLVAFALA